MVNGFNKQDFCGCCISHENFGIWHGSYLKCNAVFHFFSPPPPQSVPLQVYCRCILCTMVGEKQFFVHVSVNQTSVVKPLIYMLQGTKWCSVALCFLVITVYFTGPLRQYMVISLLLKRVQQHENESVITLINPSTRNIQMTLITCPNPTNGWQCRL